MAVSKMAAQLCITNLAYFMTGQQPDRSTPALLKLPAELRNMIWAYTLLEQDRIIVIKDDFVPELALLSTCKTIRAETLKLFYHNHDFYMSIWDFRADNILRRKAAGLLIDVVISGFLTHSNPCFD